MTNIISASKMTDRSVVAVRTLGASFAIDASLRSTGLSGIAAAGLVSLASLPVREGNERPTEAPEAAVAKAAAKAYAFAATGAGSKTRATQQHHHKMWAFRGLEPWSDPA